MAGHSRTSNRYQRYRGAGGRLLAQCTLVLVFLLAVAGSWFAGPGLGRWPQGSSLAAAEGKEKHRRCDDYPWRKTTKGKVAVIRCWARERGLDEHDTVELGRCESGADLRDRYLGDGHGGWSQQQVRYWPDRARHYGVPGGDINNTWDHSKVTTGMLADGMEEHWACAA